MRARIGDVVIDKTYHKSGRLSIVVGEGISQPILLHHRSGITMDKLGDCFSTWEGLEVIGHIDLEKIWAEAVRKADRKTENSSEKPNTCEVKNYCDDCLYTDTCDSKEFFYACTSKATISKMEQVDKDINVRSKDEPRTCSVNGRPYDCGNCEYHKCTADEPQKDCKKCKNHDRCKNNRWKCCVYEPKDEPQTERRCGNCKFLTYRFNKVWCDIKCENPHDVVCDKWAPQTDCPWK